MELIDGKYKLRVFHLHGGNDKYGSKRRMLTAEELNHGPVDRAYATVAQLVDPATRTVIMQETAICSPKDQPSRKRGYQIAVGRLMKHFMGARHG